MKNGQITNESEGDIENTVQDELLNSATNSVHDQNEMGSSESENCQEEKEYENEFHEYIDIDKDPSITNEDEIDDEILPSNIQETIDDFEASNVLVESKNQESFKCDICGKTCSNANSIRYHLKKLHGEKGQVKNHQCDTCRKFFSCVSSLNRHEKSHSNNRKKYQCQTCSKTFFETMQLKYHERIHTGEKPYSCQLCDKRFRLNSMLLKHLVTHSDKKNHECKTCGKRFTQAGNLRSHSEIHIFEITGEKP